MAHYSASMAGQCGQPMRGMHCAGSLRNSQIDGVSLQSLLYVSRRGADRGRCLSRVVAKAAANGKHRATAQSIGQLRVPSSKELQKMRQFRQQQIFRQQQQMRNVQRLAPPVPPVEKPKKQSRSASPARLKGHKKDVSKKASKKRGSVARQVDDGMSDEEFATFASKYSLEQAWRPQIDILTRLGLTPSQLSKIAESRPEIFQTSEKTMRRKIAFFKESVGMTDNDIVKIVCRSPRVLEYGSEQTVRPRLEFLKNCGVLDQNISKVVLKAPMLMSLSLKETLEPRSEFLRNRLGLNTSSLGKLISRHPQALTCTEDMMQQRVDFLMSKAGISASDLGKVVVAHPQVLHYKLDSMVERLEYLNSVGMSEKQISQAVSRFPQLFSLSVTSNMAPKWHYLVEHLGGDVNALCSYPGYFSLSLNNRIMMRHLYLENIHGSAPLPFPLGHLKMSDAKFATEVAGTTLQEYEDFKKDRSSIMDGRSDSDSEPVEVSIATQVGQQCLSNSKQKKNGSKFSNVLTMPKSTFNLV